MMENKIIIKDTPTPAAPEDLPSKYVNFEDPNSSNKALRAASSAWLYSNFSLSEPEINTLLSKLIHLNLRTFFYMLSFSAIITLHLDDCRHGDGVDLVRIRSLAWHIPSSTTVARLTIRTTHLTPVKYYFRATILWKNLKYFLWNSPGCKCSDKH